MNLYRFSECCILLKFWIQTKTEKKTNHILSYESCYLLRAVFNVFV